MVKETYSKSDFIEILNLFNIGSFKSVKYIDIAVENANYKIITTKGKFVIKIYESKDIESLKFQNKLINYLDSSGVKVAPLIPSNAGGGLVEYKGRYASVFEFIKGSHPRKLTKKIAESIGKEVGLMHKMMYEYKISPRKIYSDTPTSKSATLDRKGLRKCVVHGDLGHTNIMVNKSKVTAVLDYNDSHYDYLISDLACLIPWFMDSGNLKFLPIFMIEYEKTFRLNSKEKNCLPEFIGARMLGVLKWTEDIVKSKRYRPSQLPYLKRGLKEYRIKLARVPKLSF